jgi:hypothetical protein
MTITTFTEALEAERWARRLTTRGVCPNEPEDPISEEAYQSVIAAMDAMIAEADARPVEET